MEPLGLFSDSALTKPIRKIRRDGQEYWSLNVGHLDAGQRRVFQLWLENQSLGDIEELKIVVKPVGKKGVKVDVRGGYIPRFGVSDVQEFHVVLEASETVKADEFGVTFEFTGFITKEY